MTREETRNRIFSQFDESAKQFCEETNGLFCEISSIYKGEEKPQNLQYRFAKIYYNAFAVKFIYTAHCIMNTINSVLSCSVCFDKTEGALEILLPLAADYCGLGVETPMCIPFITNADGMLQAFDCIESVLRKLLGRFADISCDPAQKSAILTAYADEMMDLLEIASAREINETATELFVNYFTWRFSSSAFICSIKGNYAKAVKELKKVKKLTGYEKRMVRLWMSNKQDERTDVSAITANLESYNENGMSKTDFRELGAAFLSWLLLTPVFSAAYAGIYFLLVHMEGWRSVYLMGPAYNYPNCILFGMITAIAVSYFTRFKFYKWLYKKHYEKYREMEDIQNGAGTDKFMKGFLAIIVAACVTGCLLLSKWNLNFLPDGFVDNAKFLSLRGEYHSYSEIEKVYYKPDRVNDFDEVLEFPSYVLVLKNGDEIDLYEHGELSDYEKELLELLRNKGVKIENTDF